MPTVTSADGTRIAYDRHGDPDGHPLVLLHGGATRDYWRPVLPLFADDFDVYTPDRRGRGESGDHEEYSIEREAQDARAVVEAIDGDPVLYGHSYGGLQALEAARDASVAAVVAYEPAVLVGEYRERASLADRMQAHLDAGERREAMKLHLLEVLHGGDHPDVEGWLSEWPAWPAVVENVENTVRMDRAIEEYHLPDRLDTGAPTLLLTGSEGPSHLRESVRAVRESVPDSRLVEFDGLGHDGPTGAPEQVSAEVRSFLRERVDLSHRA